MSNQKVYQLTRDNQSTLMRGLIMAGGIYLSYRLGKKLLASLQKSGAQYRADDSPAVRQAMALRSAINPSGISWMKSLDMTNNTLVFDTAKQITQLDEVIKAYKNLYRDNLLDDLQSDLSGSEFQKFLSIVSSNPNKAATPSGTPPVQYAKPNQLIVAKKQVHVRSSPDASNQGKIYEQFSPKNILKTAQPGEFLGYATGKQHFDEKNNVKFIEVAYVIHGVNAPAEMKAKNKQRISYWVSSSTNYVDIFTYYKEMFDAWPRTSAVTSWMKPPDFFSLKGISIPLLISRSTAPVLNDNLVPINHVQPNVILGRFIMELNTGRDSFMQFRTIDNHLRWVEKKYITIQQSS